MNNIQTYSDLLEEKNRLEAILAIQKRVILQDFTALREEYRPTLKLLSSFGKITNRGWSNPLITMALNVAGGFFLRNLAMSGGNRLAGLVLPLMSKTISGWLSRLKGRSLVRKLAESTNGNGAS